MSNSSTSETSNPAIPTTAQLTDARQKQWHQQGEALLTLENLRSWVNAAGLILFAPRPQIVSPAPSLVEAVLGAPNSSPTIEQTSEARSLLARLIAEGLAVPLNLLGAANGAVGETPDFIASTAVFSYVFTLRGDKAWKQPPATSGALKVSQLALATHEALSRRGPLTAYDLTTELGKEVTEAAVLRALAELWTHLRVLPLPQSDGRPAIWELSSARFTKQIKAGANAGQPSALSALISLYLGQAVVASEEEIESFLSPLASRSRIRDVIHALLAARQLDTLAVEGRTVLHVAGELPAFLAPAIAIADSVPAADSEATGEAAATGKDGTAEDGGGEAPSRITKYVPKPRKIGTGYLAKAKPTKSAPSSASSTTGFKAGSKAAFKDGAKAGLKSRSGPSPDRERRPFGKPGASDRSRGFDKPWEEEKSARLAAAAKPSDSDGTSIEFAASGFGDAATDAASQPRAPRVYKPRASGSGPSSSGRPSFGDKARFGSKPSFGSKPPFRPEGRPPRRDFAPRPDSDAGDARPARKTFSKPGTFGRKREGFGGKPSFGGESRSPRREPGPRPDRVERGERGAPGGRPAFGGPRSPGSYSPRPRGDRAQGVRPPRAEGSGFAPRKAFGSRPAGDGGPKGRPSFSKDRPAFKPREGKDRFTSTESGKRVYRKFDAPRDRGERPARSSPSDRPSRGEGAGGFAAKPKGSFAKKSPGDFAPRRPAGKSSGGFAGKKPFSKGEGKGFAGKPTSTFAKFAGNKKPFGKKPPARKFKPREGESA